MTAARRDAVDHIAEQWRAERPDLDPSPIEVVGRVSRLSRLIDRHLAANFARHDLEPWMYDVLATLRRSGEPHALTAGELLASSMVTTGAITNRIDRLEGRGLVRRVADPGDRRRVLVQLTPEGRTLVDDVTPGHLATESELLAPLSGRQRAELARTLRTLLLHLGDTAD